MQESSVFFKDQPKQKNKKNCSGFENFRINLIKNKPEALAFSHAHACSFALSPL